jgi:hypothetical protein
VLQEGFADRVLAVSIAVAARWGRLNAAQPLPVDGLPPRRRSSDLTL